MSHNIDNWKTKKLENLVIPIKAFYIHTRTDWHPKQPKILDVEKMTVKLYCGCDQNIKGILKDGMLHVTSFEMHGEGSGTFMEWILEPALKQSTGELEAVIFWEGNDIIKLKVKDGQIEKTEVEI